MITKKRIVAFSVIVGVAVILSSCFGGGGGQELTVVTEPTPDPVYEPAGSPGIASFFPLAEQIDMAVAGTTRAPFAGPTGRTTPGVVATPGAVVTPGTAPLPSSSITTVGLSRPTDEQVKSGLYGGTVENTCNVERLIQFLIDNPSKGKVWAEVQGIKFGQLPDYIRSLQPRVLAADTQVINHGYDPRGYAVPIVSTLQAGSAVLVDANGDIRARCYCGNPIVPYNPPTYQPPVCLTYYAVVYSSPSDREIVDDVPRGVRATNRVATYDQVDWVEITWAGNTGWVRDDHSYDRYCRPPDTIDCVAFAQVTLEPRSDEFIGEITNGYVVVLAANVDGWTLIQYGVHSAWVPANTVGGTTCAYQVRCVTTTNGTWAEPIYNGTQLVPAGQAHRVELTGHTYADPTGVYREAYITYPAPTRLGYVKDSDITPRPETDCQQPLRCSLFDVDGYVYRDATGEDRIGSVWYTQVQVLAGPTNGRYGIDFGGVTGWVDIGDLLGTECQSWTQCIAIYGDIYNPLPEAGGTRSGPVAGFITAEFTGRVAKSGTKTFDEFRSSSVPGGFAWLDAEIGYNTLPASQCGMQPVCELPYVPDSVGECVPPPTCPDRYPIPPGGGCCPQGGTYEFNIAECEVDPCPEFSAPTLAGFDGETDTFPDDCCPGQYYETSTGGCERVCYATGEGGLFDGDGQIIGSYGPGDEILLGGESTIPVIGLAVTVTVNGVIGYIPFQPGLELCGPPPGIVQVTCSVTPNPASMDAPITVRVQWIDPLVPLDLEYDFGQGDTENQAGQTSPAELVVQSDGSDEPGAYVVTVRWTAPSTGESGETQCSFVLEVDPECRPDQVENDGGCFCPQGTTSNTAGTACITPCRSDQVVSGGRCVCPSGSTDNGSACVPDCRTDQVLSGGRCVCPTGQSESNGQCVTNCRTDQVLSGGQCVCPSGQSESNGQCQTQCQPGQELVNGQCVCPNGAADNGQCYRICGLGELNLDGLCICAEGLELGPGNAQCVQKCESPRVLNNVGECVDVECEEGYSPGFGAAEGGCYTPVYFCLYPDLDFPETQGCIPRGQCAPASAGYFILGNNTCQFEPPFCETGYSPGSNGCETPIYQCSYPNLDNFLSGSSQPLCISRSSCSANFGVIIDNNACEPSHSA